MIDYIGEYKKWIEKVKDESLLKELKSIKNNGQEIKNRFYKHLEFGTGGLRGIIGAGINCLNIYTIRKATAGLCRYLIERGGKTAAISHDSRINSRLFAETAAAVFASYGIKTYIVKELMPTPFLSFAVRCLKADAGVMVTASHNPSKYNGYKVYGGDGCQLTDDASAEVTRYIEKIDAFETETGDFDYYLKSGLIEYIDESVEEKFLRAAVQFGINKIEDLKICFTPLNGSGYRIVPKILKMQGAKDIVCVSGQDYPDGNFSTCPYPNPEKAEALKLGLETAEREKCDILLATDPDADRVGVAVCHSGRFSLLTGNETGVLLCEYLLSQKSARGTLTEKPLIVKTIVTTELAEKIASSYGAEIKNTLTGFKYIGEIITQMEGGGNSKNFVLGFEESYGYLGGDYIRDKDAVGTCMLIAEMASYYKKQGLTLIDVLSMLYRKYGKYQHKLVTKEFAGADGAEKMKALLAALRQSEVNEINGLSVTGFTDYLTQTKHTLPKANVLCYDLEGGAQVIIRPSGTEPLIKFYLTAASDDGKNKEIFGKITDFIEKRFK